MNAEKYTQKSLEAVRESQELVIRNQNMQIDQQHLLYALLNQDGGLIAQLMKKMRVESGEDPRCAGQHPFSGEDSCRHHQIPSVQ